MNLYKIEIKKAVSNKIFIGTLFIMIAITLYSAISLSLGTYELNSLIKVSLNANEIINPNLAQNTVFNSWIGGEWITFASSLFFLLLPLCSTLPYGLSYYNDKKSGYINQLNIRVKRIDYYMSKYLATFISGGLVIVIPVIINVLVVSCFIPAIKPDIFYDIYYNMPCYNMWSELFYNMPWLYIILKIFLIFLIAGGIATISLSISLLLQNKFAILILPFIFFVILNYGIAATDLGYELSPISFLYAGSLWKVNLWIVLGETIAIILIPLCILFTRGKNNDIL